MIANTSPVFLLTSVLLSSHGTSWPETDMVDLARQMKACSAFHTRTHTDIESDLWNITHEPAHTCAQYTKQTRAHTRTHTHPGLHGDCFSAHVNLPPASVSVCSVNNPVFLTAPWLTFSAHCSLSTINNHNHKYPVLMNRCDISTGHKQFLIAPSDKRLSSFYSRLLETQFACLPVMQTTMTAISPSWRFTFKPRHRGCSMFQRPFRALSPSAG